MTPVRLPPEVRKGLFMFLQQLKSAFTNIHISPIRCIVAFFSSTVLGFGLYNIHSLSGVTEGGILGFTLLLQYWFAISPSISGFVLNTLCYVMGFRLLGKEFIIYSFLASFGFSLSYKICEGIGPLWPQLAQQPFAAAILGAIFVGVSVGLCVRMGGAPSGDDALAMSLSHVAHINIRWVYLILDLIVLALSVSYLPLQRIAYSLLSVILSGQIVGWMQWTPSKKSKPT